MARDPIPAPRPKVAASALAGGTIAPFLVWVWSVLVPAHPMPAEAAASVAPWIGAAVGYLIAWLPKPG